LEELKIGVASFQEKAGSGWLEAFADFYLTEKVTCSPGEACGLPSFAPEVARADQASREAYQAGLLKLVGVVEAGLPDGKTERREIAWEFLAKLVGAVKLARAVPDPELATEIRSAVRHQIGKAARNARSRVRRSQVRTRVRGTRPAANPRVSKSKTG
jgi:TetR/AcrR family transcriptional regulator, transcriptional repressor for nem operon